MSHPKAGNPKHAHKGGRPTKRLRHRSRLETVWAHHLGRLAYKPSADRPKGHRPASRLTTSGIARIRPPFTAWCSSMRPASSLTARPTPNRSCRATSKTEFDALLECDIVSQAFLGLHCGECCPNRLLALSCKRRAFCPSCGAARGACRKPLLTWSTTSFRTCRRGNRCCRCRSRCGAAVRLQQG